MLNGLDVEYQRERFRDMQREAEVQRLVQLAQPRTKPRRHARTWLLNVLVVSLHAFARIIPGSS